MALCNMVSVPGFSSTIGMLANEVCDDLSDSRLTLAASESTAESVTLTAATRIPEAKSFGEILWVL